MKKSGIVLHIVPENVSCRVNLEELGPIRRTYWHHCGLHNSDNVDE